jgi:integrase
MANRTRSAGRQRRGNGEGSIYFDSSKAVYRGAVTLADGRRRRVQAATHAECVERLAELQGNAVAGLPVGSTDLVGAYLEWWLDAQAAKVGAGDGDMSVNTLLNYRWALAPVIDAHAGRRLRDLEPEHVEGVLVRLARQGKSRESVKRVRSVTAQALDTALRRGKVHRNVARLAEMPRTPAPAEKRALNLEQAGALLAAASGDPVEAFVVTGLMLGLRPGELLGLRWDDIDLVAGTLEVTGSLKREPAARPGETETFRRGDVKRGIRQSRRRLDMPAAVVEALRVHQVRQKERQLAAGEVWANTAGLVFTTELGRPISPTNMNKKLAKVTERAGLGRWSITELARHSAASIMSAAGVPLEVIADTLGHSSTRMLEKHYRHQVRPSMDAHVAVMDGLFGGAGR